MVIYMYTDLYNIHLGHMNVKQVYSINFLQLNLGVYCTAHLRRAALLMALVYSVRVLSNLCRCRVVRRWPIQALTRTVYYDE